MKSILDHVPSHASGRTSSAALTQASLDYQRIEYGFHPTPFGNCLLGVTPRGICWLSFLDDGSHREAFREIKSHWSGAELVERPEVTTPVATRIFSDLEKRRNSLGLLLMGTNFQIKVWQALLSIAPGTIDR